MHDNSYPYFITKSRRTQKSALFEALNKAKNLDCQRNNPGKIHRFPSMFPSPDYTTDTITDAQVRCYTRDIRMGESEGQVLFGLKSREEQAVIAQKRKQGQVLFGQKRKRNRQNHGTFSQSSRIE